MTISFGEGAVLHTRSAFPARTWVLAAHPDDETIGVGATLAASPDCGVFHLTQGAPANAALRPAGAAPSREAYAAQRRSEAEVALAWAGIPPERILCFGADDMEAIRRVAELAHLVARALIRVECAVLVTHPYEGGHPDHDATALVAHLARALIWRTGARPPRLYEMTSYHAREGRFRAGEFLSQHGVSFERVLDEQEVALKRRMIDAFSSQRETLAQFPVATERVRPAPPYRFDAAPHAGALWYEQMGWMDGREWRTLAGRALEALSFQGDACL